jgi:hypothetical protein
MGTEKFIKNFGSLISKERATLGNLGIDGRII